MTDSKDPGRLNQHITIQRLDKTARDALGQPKKDAWVDVCACWAEITVASVREFWAAKAAHAELTHRVTIRYRKGITADMRVLWGSRELKIAAPPADYNSRRQYLVLKCREVTT